MSKQAGHRNAVIPRADLLGDIRSLIQQARERVAVSVNSTTVVLYWQIGKRIREDVLKNERAGYGEQIVSTLSKHLSSEYGSGFSEKSLHRMIQFAEVFPDQRIVASLMRQLSWTHFLQLIPLEDEVKREFYAEMCRVEGWSVRQLRERMSSMLFERTAVSKKPQQLIKKELAALRDENALSSDMVFRDPYVLDFLGLKDTFAEKDLEQAILREMESFILELGVGFSFVARQKKIVVDGDEYYLDLLFYHRLLRRLVAVELKLDKFKPGYKGQMELYLRWLEKYEMQPEEKTPLGLILCAGKSNEQIELMQLERSGIRVSQYLTELPPRKILERKLHHAIIVAREQIAQRKTE